MALPGAVGAVAVLATVLGTSGDRETADSLTVESPDAVWVTEDNMWYHPETFDRTVKLGRFDTRFSLRFALDFGGVLAMVPILVCGAIRTRPEIL